MIARHRLRSGIALLALPLFGALLAACGSSSSTSSTSIAGATATATCPPAGAFKSVTGTITTVGSGAITLTDSNGAVTQVQLPSSVRITRTVSVTAADLPSGTAVQVVTDTNATTAKSIRVVSGTAGAGQGGFGPGGGFGGRGGANGTPGAGANPGCFRRGQGAGQGQTPGQGSGFQGLRGTVDSATSAKLTFDDSQGQTYSVAITSSTTISKVESAQASDLRTGMKVTVVGDTTSGGLTARTIAVQ